MVVLGASLFLMIPMTDPDSGARLAALVLGSLLALSGVYSLGAPELRTEYAHVVLGLVLFLSPWVLGFAGPASWLCWVVGTFAVLLGLAALPEADPAEAQPRSVSELTEVSETGGRHHMPDPDEQVPAATGSSTLRTFSRWSGEIEE